MSSSVHSAELTQRHSSASYQIESGTSDSDNAKLEQMGYKAELQRSFSIWSVLGVGFGLTNSWFGISAALITGISSGGPLLIVYGIIIIASVSTCIAITLSELSSAMPNSGGQYYWTLQLAPKKYANFLAYACGSLRGPAPFFVVFCHPFHCPGNCRNVRA